MQIIDKSVYTFSKDNPPFCNAQGDVEINQACRPMRDEMVNIRMGIPKITDKGPLIGWENPIKTTVYNKKS